MVILCACGIHILLSVRNANKYFWRRCRGSNWLKISSNSLIKFTSLSLLILAGLPLLSVSLWFLQSSAGPNLIYHITSTQIQKELGEFFFLPEEIFLGSRFDNTSFILMAQKTLRQFSAPSNSHIPTGLNNYQGTDGFEIKTRLVSMFQANPLCGKTLEDAHAVSPMLTYATHNADSGAMVPTNWRMVFCPVAKFPIN